MASTQGEGLHILLVVFIVLAVGAGVAAALMYQKATSEQQLKEAAQKKFKEQQDASKRLIQLQSKMRELVGFPEVKDEAALKLMEDEIMPYVKDRPAKTYRQALQALRERGERAEDNYDRAEESRKKLLTEFN